MTSPFIPNPDYFERKILGMWITGQGRIFHTHGDQKGTEGVWNAQGQVKGIWDAPVELVALRAAPAEQHDQQQQNDDAGAPDQHGHWKTLPERHNSHCQRLGAIALSCGPENV